MFYVKLLFTSPVRFRTPLSALSESNTSALFMLTTSFDQMYKSFTDIFWFSIVCVATFQSFLYCSHLIKSMFTFSCFKISSFLDKCSFFIVFEAIIEQQSINFVSLSTNCLMEGRKEHKTMCFHASFIAFSCSSDGALLILFVLYTFSSSNYYYTVNFRKFI